MKRKYSLNEDYFKVINTPEKAYFLGFMYADGCVQKDLKRFHLCISAIDIEILKRLQKALNTDRPIRRILIRDKKRVRLDIYSKRLVKGLIRYGCVNKKTFVLKYPHILKKYDRHFIRGYLDGDGCIHVRTIRKKYSYLMAKLTSTKDLLRRIKRIVHNKNKLIKTKSKNIYSLYFYGNSKEFLNWCYKDTDLFLKRKWSIWQNYIKKEELKK